MFEVAEPIHCRIIVFCEFLHSLSRCDFDLWPLDLKLLQHFECHVCIHCTTFEKNRIIRRWVIDDLARFRGAIWAGVAFLPKDSQGCLDPISLNLARTLSDHSYTRSLLSSNILLHFQTQVAQSWVMLKTDKEIYKESSWVKWVKLKAFATNVGRPRKFMGKA